MLPRGERLNSTAFARAFAGGRVLRHPLLQVRVLRRASHGAEDGKADDGKANAINHINRTRTAFVVPKKFGKAALRNRLRRRLRERYRLHPLRARLDEALRGCDLIFVAAPPALLASVAELDEAFAQLLRRAARVLPAE